MTLALAVLALVTAVNPLRAWTVLPDGAERRLATLVGTGLALGAVLAAALLASPLLDAIDLSPPMARLAAGIVLLLAGAWGLIGPPLAPTPALDGWRAGVVPVAVPALVRPEIFLVALVIAADHGVAPTLVIAAAALVAVVVLAFVPTPARGTPASRLLDGGVRFVAGLATAAGLGLLMDGLYAL